MHRTLLLFLLLLSAPLAAQYDAARYPVIPRPFRLLPFSGDFPLTEKTVIVTENKSLREEAEFFRSQVRALYGLDLQFATKAAKGNVIFLSSDSAGIPSEGYQLFINRGEISLYGGTAGIFYGLETLLQLIHAPGSAVANEQQLTIPSCSILDQPRFSWRGLHLDVSRHFFPKENIREYLRWMAMYKLNTFHWHLTDDQGWRIEIKKHPELTTYGAWRKGTRIGHYSESPAKYDTIRYGGFYTQEEIREVVRYADSLHITIVPEIEMPGHASAMLASDRALSCSDGTFSVQGTWGVFEEVLCPTEYTFRFLDEVLTEVCALFPGKYIHIGGDECPKAQWKLSGYCQQLIAQNKLRDEDELQFWFTKRVVEMLQQKGKQAIGWDEILEGGTGDSLPQGAAVMSWRGEAGGIAAAKAGRFVVMSPGSHCYFDHYQSANPGEPLAIGGYLPLEKVYGYNPVPASLSGQESKFILGVQANVWTEYIADWNKVQYMLFPRICALAEVAWSQQAENNYAFFYSRLLTHLTLCDRLHLQYARCIFDVKGRVTPTSLDAIGLVLETQDPSLMIRFSVSDSFNGNFDRVYDFPVIINRPVTIHAAAFRGEKQVGRTSEWEFAVNLATGKPITLRKAPDAAYNSGGAIKLVDGQSGSLPWRVSDWLGWQGDTLDATIDLGKDTLVSSVGFQFLQDAQSWIHAPEKIRMETSEDGKNFRELKPVKSDTNSAGTSIGRVTVQGTHRARYVRIVVTGLPEIPAGLPGEGNPAWLFISEIEVR